MGDRGTGSPGPECSACSLERALWHSSQTGMAQCRRHDDIAGIFSRARMVGSLAISESSLMAYRAPIVAFGGEGQRTFGAIGTLKPRVLIFRQRRFIR